MDITFPSLIIDLDIIRTNIKRMAEKASRNQAEFRPHFKTHQSKEIGRIFREFDVEGITVSSPKMARYFVEDGWKDITIAFPLNVNAAKAYDELSDGCKIKTLIISSSALKSIDRNLSRELGLYIEIDPEYERSGIPVTDHEQIKELIDDIEASTHCYLAGFYCHAGHTYNARSESEIYSIAEKALKHLDLLKKKFPEIPICYGDTPSCSVLEEFGPVDQLSPGNFVFYDWMQVEIGSCSPDEIAMWMVCPVIEKFEDRKQILIHGGAVHFSKDGIESSGKLNFGQVFTDKKEIESYLSRLSQEHGIINCEDDFFNAIQIGDTVKICPIHSCLNADLMGEYYTKDGDVQDHMNKKMFN